MNPFSEIKEIKPAKKNDLGNGIKAFDKVLKDVSEIKHLTTIREDLEGKTYPGTNVLYKLHRFRLEGQKVEGVFPVFESKFDTCLPKDLWRASDNDQFKACTKRLQQKIEKNPEFAKNFTPRQLEQIKNGEPRIGGLTWHHNEIPGKMQLVKADIHATAKHTGGKSLWGGGNECR